MLSSIWVVLSLGLGVVYYMKQLLRSSPNYPPGPPGLPIIGNLLQIPISRLWVKFREWAIEYGPIFHLKVGSDHMIVLNTPEAADDLLVKQGSIFSGRMAPHVAADIISAGQRAVLFHPSTSPLYKAARKSLTAELGPTPVKQYRHGQDLESCVLLHDLLSHGEQTSKLMNGKALEKDKAHDFNFLEHHWYSLIRRFTTSVILTAMYGERVHKIAGNKDLHTIYEVVDCVGSAVTPGTFLADTFTILQTLPDFLAPWRLKAQQMHRRDMELYGSYLDKLRSEQKAGLNRTDCYVGKYFKARDTSCSSPTTSGLGTTNDGWLRDTGLMYTAATVLEAGSDTTASMMNSFFLFMLAHPSVVRKAQEELDRVVGGDRLPSFEDEGRLPYIVAIIKEVLRCRPAAPLGVPHQATEDFVYRGYFIPKGSIVFGNVWGMHLDPRRFEDPMKFYPERWLSLHSAGVVQWGSLGTHQSRDHFAFGWGRRFCLGSYLAEASLFITISRVLWGLVIYGVKDPMTGEDAVIDPWNEENYAAYFVTNPFPFNVSFQPRSSKHADVIQQAYEDAQGQWENLGLSKDEL